MVLYNTVLHIWVLLFIYYLFSKYLCVEYYVHCPLSVIHLLKELNKLCTVPLEWVAGCQLICRRKWSQRSSVLSMQAGRRPAGGRSRPVKYFRAKYERPFYLPTLCNPAANRPKYCNTQFLLWTKQTQYHVPTLQWTHALQKKNGRDTSQCFPHTYDESIRNSVIAVL